MNPPIGLRIEERFGKSMTDLSGLIPAFFPSSVDAISEFFRYVSRERIRVLVTGGATLPEPVLIDDTVRLSLARLNAVTDVNAGDSVVAAQAGAIADIAVEAAEEEKLFVALDPSSGARSTVGGAFMTAASGPYAAGYGPFRDAVIGVRCVAATGDIVTFGGRTMKNVTGFEITRFLAGSYGLFAVAVELTVKAFPLPERRLVLVGRFAAGKEPFAVARDVEKAGNAVKFSDLIAQDGLGSGMFVAVGVEGMEGAVVRSAARVRDMLEASGSESITEMTCDAFVRVRRAASLEIVRSGMLTVAAPPSAASSLLAGFRKSAPEAPVIAHPLTGRIHIHPHDSEHAEVIGKHTLALGGKRPLPWGWAVREGIASAFTPRELEIARSLKQALDPAGILNPHFHLG